MSSDVGASGRRLDSWKEIAGHFGRDVRTVQRWEEREGLPVHRHQHDFQVTVYAYSDELNAWLARRSPISKEETPAVSPSEEPKPASTSWRLSRNAMLGVGTAAVLIIIIISFVWVRSLTAHTRLGFQPRDWVLLAGFENRTGEPLFNDTLPYALERELSISRFVNVAPRERANDALRLMGRALDVEIDVSTAREICLRDGGIKAVVAGRAEKFGTNYVFSAQVLEPRTGGILAADEEQAAGKEQVWPAVRKLSNWLRLTLGEQLANIQEGNQRLQKVTTPSLGAVQLYTQSEAAGRANQWGAAEQLVQQALEADPEFASGWIWLAWCLRYQGKEIPKFQFVVDKAMQYSPKATERERLFIIASSHQFAYRNKEAVEAYTALVRHYPDDFWGRRNLIYVCAPEDYPGLLRTYAELRPNDFRSNSDAAISTLAGAGDFSVAQYYWNRASRLVTPETGSIFPGEVIEFKLFPVYRAWLNDDPRSGLDELARLGQSTPTGPIQRKLLAANLGLGYLSFGQVKAAEEWFRRIEDESVSHDLLALAAYAGGDQTMCREHAAKFFLRPESAQCTGYSSGVTLARVGWIQDPQGLIEHYRRHVENIFVIHMQGELALSQGHIDNAIQLLRQATDNFRQGGNQEFLISSDGLALALERRGELAEALRVLEQASPARSREIAWESPTGVFWLRIEAHLARLYRQNGRTAEARQIEDQLRRILAYADADFPVRKQLEHIT